MSHLTSSKSLYRMPGCTLVERLPFILQAPRHRAAKNQHPLPPNEQCATPYNIKKMKQALYSVIIPGLQVRKARLCEPKFTCLESGRQLCKHCLLSPALACVFAHDVSHHSPSGPMQLLPLAVIRWSGWVGHVSGLLDSHFPQRRSILPGLCSSPAKPATP